MTGERSERMSAEPRDRTGTLRYVLFALGLAAAWVMLWDQVSAANVVGGLLVAAVLLALFPLRSATDGDHRRIDPLALGRLGVALVHDLAVSNVLVAREILSPKHRRRTGIVACRLRTASPTMVSTLANILALSPGTMAVEAERDPATLYVHVLLLDDPLAVRRRIAHLERLVIEALGSAADREALFLTSGHGPPHDGGAPV